MLEVSQHIDKVRNAVESGDAARSALVASWRRCTHGYGLDPANTQHNRVLTAAELKASTEKVEPLLYSASATLDRLQGMLEGQGICILIAGTDGVSVDWRGDGSDVDELQKWGLWPGVDWSEQVGGTNGIGTGLVDKRPMVVDRDEHFYVRDVSCAVAPIFDHVGALGGVLNVTLYGASASNMWAGPILGLVKDAAQQIEIDHFHRVFQDARIVSVPIGTRSGAALLAVDADDVVLGATRPVRRSLGLTDTQLREGVCASDLFVDREDGFEHAERSAIRRALVRTSGNVSLAAKALNISRATLNRKLASYRIIRQLRGGD